MTQCEFCGKNNDEGAIFCCDCGSSLVEQAHKVLGKPLIPEPLNSILVKALTIYLIILLSAGLLFVIGMHLHYRR